jgi:hypothetical protein
VKIPLFESDFQQITVRHFTGSDACHIIDNFLNKSLGPRKIRHFHTSREEILTINGS